jgi:hypothetical protein
MTETMEGFRPALYYPYIHIRSEDWLKATLLCVPVVKRLIPDNYDPEDTGNIAPYAKIAGPYGALLQRVPAYSVAADQAQQELFGKIRGSLATIQEAYGRARAPAIDEYLIHDAKFSGSLLAYLEDEGLAWKSVNPNAYGQRNWYALHPTLGKAVMTCIGLWRVGGKVKRYVQRRQKSNHFLSQISYTESEVLRLQFPLGLDDKSDKSVKRSRHGDWDMAFSARLRTSLADGVCGNLFRFSTRRPIDPAEERLPAIGFHFFVKPFALGSEVIHIRLSLF